MGSPDPYELAHVEALLHGYDARWGSERYEVLGVEVEFRAPLLNPETGAPSRTYQRGGKLDVIVRELSERAFTLIVEHKSAAEDISPGSTYWRKLVMDGQVSGYFLGAEALGFHPDACLYDVIGKCGLRPYKATPLESRRYTKAGKLDARQHEADETPEEYFNRCIEMIAAAPDEHYRRGDVVRIGNDLDEALWDDWQQATIMRESHRAGRYPRNPDACMRWGRACEYFDVCTGAASIDDQTRFVRSSHVSPELSPLAPGELPILSASRLHSARACQRLHKFQYIDGYRPVVTAEPLRFGSLLHRGLEGWWSARKPEERLEAAIAAVRTHTP